METQRTDLKAIKIALWHFAFVIPELNAGFAQRLGVLQKTR